MKINLFQKLMIRLLAAVLVLFVVSTSAYATTYYYYARPYFGNVSPAVIPGNGVGGTVSFSWSGSTSNDLSTNTEITTSTTSTSARTLTVRITPTAGTYRIKSVKSLLTTSSTAPTESSSWNEVSDTTNYNADTHYDIPLSVSRNSNNPHSKYTYVWVTFELIDYKVTTTILDDTPSDSTLAHCSATASVGTTSAIGSSTAYPTALVVSPVTPNTTQTIYIFNTNSYCEIAGVSFEGGASNWSGAARTSGSTYTTASITSSNAPATVEVLFRHIGYTIAVTTTDTTPSCGSITPMTTVKEAGASQLFTIIKNNGCAIDTVLVDGTNVTADVISVTNPTGVNTYNFSSANMNQNHTLAVTLVKVSTTLGAQYCQRPAFMLEQATMKPNVLMILDNSGSMGGTGSGMGLAYRVSGKTYGCTYSGINSTIGSGTCQSYYGYFDPTKMYTVSGSTYTINTSWSGASNLADTSDSHTGQGLSGNYLNFYNTQKIDVLRKILVGGRVDDSAGAARGTSGSAYYLKQNDGKYVESGTTEPTGIVHSLYDKVRFGIMNFNGNGSDVGSDDGGYISAKLGTSLDILVNTIEGPDTDPSTNTPLGESLYEAVRYFEAKSSVFNSLGSGVTYGTQNTVDGSGNCTAWNGCPSTDTPPEKNKIIQYACQKNFVLIVTDGEPTKDQNIPGNPDISESATDANFSLSSWWNKLSSTDRAALTSGTTKYWLPAVAYYAHNTDLRSTALSNDMSGTQNLSVYTVYAFGSGAGTATLTAAAKYGAYVDTNKNGVPDAGEFSTGYYAATDGAVLEQKLNEAFGSIMDSAGSGTAAAVANNKSGERGANMIQALFYPQWPNDTTKKWMGEVQALWYYLDPVISYSGIFQDTDGNKTLDLLVDKALSGDSFTTKSLWKAGAMLQLMSAADRKIYTPISVDFATTNPPPAITGSGNEFKSANLSNLRDRMNLGTTSVISDTQAGYMIDYIRGSDRSEYRSRKVNFTNPITGSLNTTVATEWKLGDIINSTPSVQSSIPLNAYNKSYSDSSYDLFVNSAQYAARNVVYTSSNDGMIHAFRLGLVTNINNGAQPNLVAKMTGTNLGTEEWAFIPKNALPYLQNQSGTEYCHQCLVDGAPLLVDASIFKPSSSTCTDYWDCDRKTTTSSGSFVASDTSWGTVLVSGMGLGGATRDMGTSTDMTATAVAARNCNETLAHDSVPTNNIDCVKTPKTGIGLSSYFALDITTPLTPKYMWEFSDYSIAASADKGLGFTTPGAAIVRINTQTAGVPDKTKNGRWFAVFASGPTGTLKQSGGASDGMFRGRSDQNLKLYIVDLNATMPFTKGTNYWVKDTSIPFAFANSLSGSVVDLDRWDSTKTGYYSDDVVYVTYTKASLKSGFPDDGLTDTPPVEKNAWDKGGIIRLVTKNDPDPGNWFVSSLIEDTGPITSSIGKLQDRNNKKMWVYFGEGRFFHPGDETGITRKFYGVEDPCYKQYSVASQDAMGTDSSSCPAVSMSDLQDQGGTPPSVKLNSDKKGWYITMDAASGTSGAERIVSDVTASTNGIVFYTTFTPNTDPCVPGGTTSLWAVKYDTGGTAPKGSLVGKAPVQTSSGGITLVDLATKFTEKSGRKLDSTIHADGSSLMGMASGKGIRPLLSNKGLKRILHIQEQ